MHVSRWQWCKKLTYPGILSTPSYVFCVFYLISDHKKMVRGAAGDTIPYVAVGSGTDDGERFTSAALSFFSDYVAVRAVHT